MTRFRNGVNLYLKSKKKKSVKKVKEGDKLSKRERRNLEKKKIGMKEIPLPNVVFKDNAPMVVVIIGEEKERNLIIEKVFGKFIAENTFDTTKFCENFVKEPIRFKNNFTFFYKSRRITLLQVHDDINSLIDYSKIADLSILAIHKEITFTMFEYISLLSAHGLSKLCAYHSNASASLLRRRIYKETSVKIPIFNTSTLLLNYINRMKIRPLSFRSKNSYILVDNIFNNSFYGYLRGTPLIYNHLHIPGVGDFEIEKIERMNKDEKIKYEPQECNDDISEEDVTEGSLSDSGISSDKEESNLEVGSNDSESSGNSKENNSNQSSEQNEDESSLISNKGLRKGLTDKELEGKYERKYIKKSFLEKEKEDYKKMADKCNTDLIPGAYVKIELKEKEKINKIKDIFNKNNFILLGGISSTKRQIVYGNIKPHKWNTRFIKSNSPAVVSLGWHRMLIYPILSISDGKRERFLKHNLEYNNISFYSPVYENSRFVLLKNDGFRIHGVGLIDNNKLEMVKKKCKLVGEVTKSYNNTVFIKNMFNSRDEVMKFIGAKLSSVSKLRGIVKRPISNGGDFRATFEGELKVRDVVFLKCYFPMEYTKKCIYDDEKISEEIFNYTNELIILKKEEEEKKEIKSNIIVNIPVKKRELYSKELKQMTYKLPFNKREIIEDTNLLISPEEKQYLQMKEEFFKAKEKNLNDKMIIEKENFLNKVEEKKQGKIKSIIKSAIKNKRKFKKSKKKGKKRNK